MDSAGLKTFKIAFSWIFFLWHFEDCQISGQIIDMDLGTVAEEFDSVGFILSNSDDIAT